MCLILFALGSHARFPLIVAANRDESHARPSSPAAFWSDHPDVYGGRDLEQGGTWVGISRKGRFAAVTNFRQRPPRMQSEYSRGELTRDYLTGDDTPEAYLERIESRAAAYNGFSLIVGGPRELWFFSNRGAAPQQIPGGVHGLSNHLLNEPWPKVLRGRSAVESLLDANEDELSQGLLNALSDRTPAPEHLLTCTGAERERERSRSAAFIESSVYGTRASTVILVDREGETRVIERTYGAGGLETGESDARFRVEMTVNRLLATPARV